MMSMEIAEARQMCPNIPLSCDHVNYVLQQKRKDRLCALVKIISGSASPSTVITSTASASMISPMSSNSLTDSNNTAAVAPIPPTSDIGNLGGEGQGEGASPIMWFIVLIVMINTFNTFTTGAIVRDPISMRKKKPKTARDHIAN